MQFHVRRTLCRLNAEGHAEQLPAVLCLLAHSNAGVRSSAVRALDDLGLTPLAQPSVLQMFSDSSGLVQKTALEAIRGLPAETLEQHAAAVVAMF